MKGVALLVLAAVGLVLTDAGCYRDCDPAKEPNTCPCPPGACGPYPGDLAKPKDAGADG